MLLKELLNVIDYKEIINRSGLDPEKTDVASLCSDSRKATEGSMFVCISGSLADGHDFARSAYSLSCRIFVTEHPLSLPDDAFVIVTSDTRVALAKLSAHFFAYPAKEMTVIGITGTKGKTTSSLLIYNILNESGLPTGYIGSNGISFLGNTVETLNTTPESYDLHKYMREMYDSGVKTVVMEVSSQALKMARVHGIKFKICVFTNLSPDHIGEFEHPDFEDYKNCKHSLFTDYGAEYIVYNADDGHSAEMTSGNRCKKIGISLEKDSDYKAQNITYFRSPDNIGVSFECTAGDSTFPVALSFPGEFSVYNALTAIAVCNCLGLSAGKITKTMRHVKIKGRFETIEIPNGATVVIDYAHNGVSLKAALQALRVYDPTRLICLFGSVGGRTKMRRAELGLVASRDADFCILTSDNPDNESPTAIIGEIASYFTIGTCPYIAIADRKKAIEYALSHSKKGDIILLAGKGHETYQSIGGVREYFCESEIVKDFCAEHALEFEQAHEC
ncbi:MAG: UDP-N-acetylmuramoyl-L-alanyl-D-glutamate--2,6-diaminopimelate ligase [Clostridia bacterium]|nr:UDP-N-acetylmuramoyl-L-alanyl-D-glutamate--2,6-diaminopimelate ligase [Clostridia bacterium]